MIFIYPYNKASKAAWALLEALEEQGVKTRLIKLQNSSFDWGAGKFVINWGNGSAPGPCLNRQSALATNKLKTFKKLQEANVSIPDFTTSLVQAQAWLADGHEVFARTKIAASEGEGIVNLRDHPNTIAPLYVKYIKKAAEYRVHVFLGSILKVQQKLRKTGAQANRVRNTANGYIFGNAGPDVPTNVLVQSRNAVNALGLDFGAVDIIWNNKRQQAYVLEINTAPGIEGSTVTDYATAFKNLYQSNQ